MNFSRFLDIQSWWEVPSIAYFCSLFRTAFNLLDFDIEELEEALLTDGTEDSASSLLTELIVRLLNGCLGNNDISAFNYQMYLRRLFRRKCQETGRYNPFDSDIDFQFLPLRTKVEILYALCDFRLDADDVFDLFKNLEAESLRVEPLGWDDNDSAYWYFYGTRLYREDIIRKSKTKGKRKKNKETKRRGWGYGEDWFDDEDTERVWQVICFTEEDWTHLTEKFSKATSKVEKELYRSLSQNFLPEIPRLFQEKERLQRKRLLESAPRRTSSRVLQKIKQKEEESKQSSSSKEYEEVKNPPDVARKIRASRRNLIRSQSVSSGQTSLSSEVEEMPQKTSKRSKSHDKKSKASKVEYQAPPEPVLKRGRKTNNSLSAATGQIVIPDSEEPPSSTRKKLKTSQIFSQTEEDVQTDMYKVLEQLLLHDDAWPFLDPVEEEFAPNYYAVIRRPMDLRKMEERLDKGYYTDFSMFKADFKLIVNNCRLYNGHDNEYSVMVDNLQAAFDRLTQKYIHRLSSSDEEIAVEYQIPTPSRKHKLKSKDSPSKHKKKKRKTHSATVETESNQAEAGDEHQEPEINSSKESQKTKGKKKRKGHHRHGKHSKSHKKRSGHSGTRSSKHKKQKHTRDKEGKKNKEKKKKSKHNQQPEPEEPEETKRCLSPESLESSHRSRSASPLPSIHTLSPSPTEQLEQNDQLIDPDFYKDKYDKIKERRRNATKDSWDSLFTNKQKVVDKKKQNINIPQKDKNQKLKETIEKLRAKNEKYKDASLFNSLFNTNQSEEKKYEPYVVSDSPQSNNEIIKDDEDETQKDKQTKKGRKKNTAKNESASEALEQAVKDISKWLDDAPKATVGSHVSESPSRDFVDDHDINRGDDELSQSERTLLSRRDMSRKRLSSREPKLLKRREIQRTIDRLQPGKSKGNLLTNINVNKAADKIEEVTTPGNNNKQRDPNKGEEASPKLSLGSVLPTVEFVFGADHNFDNSDKCTEPKDNPVVVESKDNENQDTTSEEKKTEVPSNSPVEKKDAEVETEPTLTTKPNQEKATPNLSAWFKAFGTPKSSSTTSVKKKPEDNEADEKVNDNANINKPSSPKNSTKLDSPNDPDNNEGGDSPLPSTTATPRQRRTSTGSSVSERSSFSQDLDSPRHQMSHTSPLLRSPASPRIDEFQKITYPIMNGTVRAGFYQDTTSVKSSPDKSCSPREAPQSPYSPYTQHVYASNSIMGSATPNYFVDQNKSPIASYNQSLAQGETSKTATGQQEQRPAFNDDYTSLLPEPLPHNHNTFPPKPSPYQQSQSIGYSHVDISSHPSDNELITPINITPDQSDPKGSLFPVKKRTYNEQDGNTVTMKKLSDAKQSTMMNQNKNEYQKTQSDNTIREMAAPLVDDIALALCEKTENRLQAISQKGNADAANIKSDESRVFFNNNGINNSAKLNLNEGNKTLNMLNKDDVDMVNMGYMNPDNDRRFNNNSHENEYALREAQRQNLTQQKSYDTALNLGIQSTQKGAPKHTLTDSNQPDISNKNIAHAHQSQYDALSMHQSVGKFSLNDIELANKKLYSCNSTPQTAALDYGNWKMSNQLRKDVPSDYTNSYRTSNKTSNEKVGSNMSSNSPLNYNKNSQHVYSSDYNVLRNMQRTPEMQQNLASELRIPNPRSILRNEHGSTPSSITSTDLINRNSDVHAKSQKPENLVGSHALVGSIPYKSQYSTHSPIPIESLRNLPNIPQMLERFSSDDRYLSSFSGNPSSIFHDKSFQMAQMFNKNISPDVLPDSPSVSIYPSTSLTISKDKTTITTSSDSKMKTKKKKTPENKPGIQSYQTPASSSDVLSTVKTSIMSGNPFNFGTSANMALAGGLYGDNAAFTIEDFRNSNQIMAANYMAAAVAHQQRSTAESNAEKLAKSSHQSSNHSSSFPFIGHSQVRAGYPFVGHDPSSPLYQQYLQRHQAEELLRQTGAQIMGLYSPGYPATLGVRQPYDSLNRPSWL